MSKKTKEVPTKMTREEWNELAKNNPWVIAEPVPNPEEAKKVREMIKELSEE